MEAGTLTTRADSESAGRRGILGSKRLLSLAGDDRLVDQIRRGNEVAFEVAFERHGAGILAFCRHMLGSREEAEDVVQHTFAAAYKDLQGGGRRKIALKAWLYTIARNRCVSVLRARREHASELHDLPTGGLSEQVEQRAELRELLADVGQLPEEQRAALLLAEAAGLSHAEVADVLGCETGSVKGLVFRARTALIERRDARETPCAEIREQLATLRGGALRRNELRHHLRSCPGCSAYRDEVRRQRELLAVALPVVPSVGLKSSVLGAAGLTGSAAVGGASAGGLALGSAAVAKVALVGVLAGGSVVAGEVAIEQASQQDAAQVAPARSTAPGVAVGPDAQHPAVETRGAHGEAISTERSHGLRGTQSRSDRATGHAYAGSKPRPERPERSSSAGGRRLGQEKQAGRIERTPPERGGGRTSGGRPETKQTAPAKPLTQGGSAPREHPAPQQKDTLEPVNETGAALPAPEPPADTAPKGSGPGQVKQAG
ncbi:MAG TPA: RNA polymerase sigma factor [Thermoleophilaceae bacterium]|nr:RNA polymerase sigma factor [Thermoleophilaceae bacterium]